MVEDATDECLEYLRFECFEDMEPDYFAEHAIALFMHQGERRMLTRIHDTEEKYGQPFVLSDDGLDRSGVIRAERAGLIERTFFREDEQDKVKMALTHFGKCVVLTIKKAQKKNIYEATKSKVRTKIFPYTP